MTALARISLLIAALLLSVMPSNARDAFAHAQLRATEPMADAVLDVPPDVVRLIFNEPVMSGRLHWFGPGGEEIDLPAEARIDGAVLVVPVPADLARGTHLLSWRVASLDGHPVGGTTAFSIGAATLQPSYADSKSRWLDPWAVTVRFLMTVLVAVSIGGAVFATWIDRPGLAAGWPRQAGGFAGLLVAPAGLAALGLHGLDLTGEPAGGILTGLLWQAVFQTPFAATVVLFWTAGFLATAALWRESRVLAAGSWGLAALSYAVSGHAAASGLLSTVSVAMAVHAAAMIFWAGALLPIIGVARRYPSELGPLLHSFSLAAMPLVAVLLASGAVMAFVQVDSIQSLWTTGYGRLLSLKVVGAGLLLAIAAYNKLWLTPAIATAASSRMLVRTVTAELIVMVVVLAIASGFRLTPPPRLSADTPDTRVSAHIHQQGAMADVTIQPGIAGPNRLDMVIRRDDFSALKPLEVVVSLAQADRGIEAIRANALQVEPGLWRVDPMLLPVGGIWQIELDILINDFEKAILVDDVTLSE